MINHKRQVTYLVLMRTLHKPEYFSIHHWNRGELIFLSMGQTSGCLQFPCIWHVLKYAFIILSRVTDSTRHGDLRINYIFRQKRPNRNVSTLVPLMHFLHMYRYLIRINKDNNLRKRRVFRKHCMHKKKKQPRCSKLSIYCYKRFYTTDAPRKWAKLVFQIKTTLNQWLQRTTKDVYIIM